MTALLADTSVLVKWFHSEGESEVAEARAIRDATRRQDAGARAIDLAICEMGDVVLRARHWSGRDVADQLDDLVLMCDAQLLGARPVESPRAATECLQLTLVTPWNGS